MKEVTRKLKFAYVTISNLESRIEYKDNQIAYLWKLLDDISTAGDMYKPEITNYFNYVNDVCEQRSHVAISPDGIELIISEKP